MTKIIRIGDVEFDARQYAINGTGILGIKKSGKSWLAKGIAEQMLIAGIPIIVFDAIGVWRHLKRAAGPSGRGFPIVVAGGKEPDLPLTPANAKEIVRAAIRENIPLVIDLYDRTLSKSDWRRIVQTCCRTLLYENEGVRHIFLEEAGEYVPQKVMDGETFAEVEKLVRMGGNASLGITLINPRAQEINKAVLELCENLVVMKQRGAHAIDSLEKWMDRLDPGQAKAIAASLPKLTTGECWIFSGEDDKVHRTRSGKLLTFHPDRSKPETAGQVRAAVVNDTLVTRLKLDLAAVVEEAQANDPKALRARIAELEKQLKAPAVDAPRGFSKEHLNEACDRAEREGLVRGRKEASTEYFSYRGIVEAAIESAAKSVVATLRRVTHDAYEETTAKLLGRAITINGARPSKPAAADSHARSMRSPTTPRAASASGNGTGDVGDGSLPKGERLVLTAIAQFNGSAVDVDQLFTLTGYKARSISDYVGRLRAKGYVSPDWPVIATQAGVDALGPSFEPLPTGDALLQHWRGKLPAGELKVLDVLVREYPNGLGNGDIGEATSYASRSVTDYIGRLKARRLVERVGQAVKASEALFS